MVNDASCQGQRKAKVAHIMEASNRAHFYTWVAKRGTLHRGTNWHPWKDYRVLGKWLDDLWTDQKLENSVYAELALKVKVGYASRKRDLEHVIAAEHESRVNQQLADVDQALAKLRAPSQTFSEVHAWEDTFLKVQFRWKLLVFVADSASG